MKICYLILAYNDPFNLSKLVERINDRADIFIHIDKKSDISDFLFLEKDNVILVEDRYSINWGGFNMVTATRKLITSALNSGNEYMRVVLLSGSDYPIKSSEYIYDFFLENKDRDFINGICIEYLPKKTYKKYFSKTIDKNLNYDYVPFKNKKLSKVLNVTRNRLLGLLSNKRKKYPNYLPIYGGSQWWALTPRTLIHMLELESKNSKYFNLFKTFFVPDEKYFHTLYFNLSEEKQDRKNLFKPIDINSFEDRSFQTAKLANLHILHPSLTKWYDESDLKEILESDKLFVRKVSTDKSSNLIKQIDEKMHIKGDKS